MTKDELMQDEDIHEAFLALKQAIIEAVPFWIEDAKRNIMSDGSESITKKIMFDDKEVSCVMQSLIEKIMEKQ